MNYNATTYALYSQTYLDKKCQCYKNLSSIQTAGSQIEKRIGNSIKQFNNPLKYYKNTTGKNTTGKNTTGKNKNKISRNYGTKKYKRGKSV